MLKKCSGFAAVLIFLSTVPLSLHGQLTEDERNTIDVVRRTKNSVVFITNIQMVRDFFFSEQEVARGTGSGFVWDNLGHIVTNNHVIEDGDRFMVSLPDGEQREARLVGKEEAKDIAVLRIEGNPGGLNPLSAGESTNLLVGQKVIAVGNPFGFDHTVTTGIVSALGRSILGSGEVTIRDMIQTDASINPGNSGGPLLNSQGELIGMNTVIYSGTGQYSGVGFAVPVDTIKKIVPQIIEFGRVIRPGLGVDFLADRYARRAGIEGLVILQVQEGSKAYKAGLRGLDRDRRGRLFAQDVLTAVDDFPIKSYDDYYNVLDSYKVGDEVTLTLRRGNRERKVQFTLERKD
jgi:S1-C subfamily serine protease